MNGREMRRQRGETLMGWVDRLADGRTVVAAM